jgi:hypothetical protein
MNIKELIESLIKDLYENKSLSDVFLKLQVIVYSLKNEQLTEWFNNENNGYDTNKVPPLYRNLDVIYYADLLQDRGFGNAIIQNHYNLHTDLIENKNIRDSISKYQLRQSISEINNWIDRDTKNRVITLKPVNTGMYISLFSKQLTNDWHIYNIWMEISQHSVQNIIFQVKSKVLQFLLEINENINLDISFTAMENKEKIEKAFSQNITNNIYGNNNNVATGQNVEQNINQSFVDYEKLKEYGVEEREIEELKEIEKETDKSTLKNKVFSWLGKVSAAVAARGLYDSIPAITECVKNLIN